MYRFARRLLLPDEQHIETTHDMAEYLHQYFLQTYNYSLDHLTPQRLYEWYEALIRSRELSHWYGPTLLAVPRPSPTGIPETQLTSIHLVAWKERVIAPLYQRLLHTGYEYL